ncbi:hypothetical protein [Moraxella lacunata]
MSDTVLHDCSLFGKCGGYCKGFNFGLEWLFLRSWFLYLER